MHELVTHRRVEFADTDMARIVHFSRFFDFMEAAEHEFLRRALGDDRQVHFEHEGHEIGWPRAQATCRYSSPARLGDELEITVRLRRKGNRSLTWGFTFRHGERLVAEGEITAICCRVGGPKLQAVPIPDFLDAVLEQAPSEPVPAALESA
ncbi:MAG: thioesterase family protein [Acidobacteriota bacterium]